MTKEKNNKEVTVFNNEELSLKVRAVKNDDGSISMNVEDTILGFGLVKIDKKGDKEYTRCDFPRVQKYIVEFGFGNEFPKVNKSDFIPESLFYLLGMKASNKTAVNFQKWIATDVMPSIRKHGAYIGDNPDENYVNNELRFSKGRTIKTFANTNVSNLKQLYSDFRLYTDKEYKYKTDERLARYKSVEKGLDILNSNLAKEDIGNIGDCYNVQKLKEQVIVDRTTLEKRISGGEKAGGTKKINRLQEKINSIYPRDSEFVTILVHPFSINYMYKTIENNTYKTEAYKRWIDNFPMDEVPEIEFWDDVDFTQPIELFVNYVAKLEFDQNNCDKATIDQIFNRIYGVDDNIIQFTHSQKVATVDNYENGTISFYIRNI